MYQLGMPAFTNDVEWYCKDLSDTSFTLAPNMPTVSSCPLSDEELQAIERSEAHWTGNFGQTLLFPDHPCYNEACFHCYCLGHIRINCQFYTCSTCLRNTPDHIQNCCLLHHCLNPTRTTSSSFSLSNQSNSSIRSICPVPPLLTDRLSPPPPWCTFWRSCHNHITMACIHASTIRFCGIHPPTPGTDAWRNINSD